MDFPAVPGGAFVAHGARPRCTADPPRQATSRRAPPISPSRLPGPGAADFSASKNLAPGNGPSHRGAAGRSVFLCPRRGEPRRPTDIPPPVRPAAIPFLLLLRIRLNPAHAAAARRRALLAALLRGARNGGVWLPAHESRDSPAEGTAPTHGLHFGPGKMGNRGNSPRSRRPDGSLLRTRGFRPELSPSAPLFPQADKAAVRIASESDPQRVIRHFRRQLRRPLVRGPGRDHRRVRRHHVLDLKIQDRVLPDSTVPLRRRQPEPHRARGEKREVRAGRKQQFQPEHVAIEHRGLGPIAHLDGELADVRHGVGQGSGERPPGRIPLPRKNDRWIIWKQARGFPDRFTL